MDFRLTPPIGVDRLSITERIQYCVEVFDRLAVLVGDDAFHCALSSCIHVRIPRIYSKSQLREE